MKTGRSVTNVQQLHQGYESLMNIVGEWTCKDDSSWKFVPSRGHMARFLAFSSDMGFSELELEVAKVFGVDLAETSLELTFWYPEDNIVFTQTKMPPVAIASDSDLLQFKNKRICFEGLSIYVSFCKKSKSTPTMQKISGGSKSADFGVDSSYAETSSLDDDILLVFVEGVEQYHKQKKSPGVVFCDNSIPAVSGPVSQTQAVCRLQVDQIPRTSDFVHRGDKLPDSVVDISCNVYQSSADLATTPLIDTDEGFNALIALIDKEHSPHCESITCGVAPRGPSSSFRGEHIFEIGEKSVAPPNVTPLIQAEPIGFDLGIDDIGNGSQPCRSDDEFTLNPNNVVDEVINAVNYIISEDDDFFKDAPPYLDNMRGPPQEERHMDLKHAADAIYVGRIFSNKEELNKALAVYAMKKLFTFRITKSDTTRLIASCVDRKCSWRIYVISHKLSENFEIRTVQLKHSCDVASRSRFGEKATSKVLTDLIQPKFSNGKKGPRACELPEMVLAELNVTISYMKAWHAKEIAMTRPRGNEEESFRFLCTYLHLLKITNSGTLTDMVTIVDKQGHTLFKFLFVALGASIGGYSFLRKVIVIDGTQIKEKYKGCLVAASGQDGNMQIFHLAFGVVDGENEAAWIWFFQNLKIIAPDDKDLVFVSDRHLAIYAALEKVYPLAQHPACIVHLCRNVQHRFKNEGMSVVVSKAARAFTIGDFRFWWAEIERRSPACAKYLLNIGLSHWTLSHFPGLRYNLMTSNISESLNSALSKAVDYPVVTMLELLRTKLMRWFCLRREKAKQTQTICTPEIEFLLNENLKESIDCGVLAASEWVYQVNDGMGCVFTVDLENKTCTCRGFQLMKIPCSHALAARGPMKVDIYSLIGQCYRVEPWCNLYQQIILPLPRAIDVDVPPAVSSVELHPPKTKRGSGRPRKQRIPSRGEVPFCGKKRVPKCGRCFGAGHNRKTCKLPI